MPTKAAYEDFDAEGSALEFDFYLTERLGWGSVERMRRGLSAREYLYWSIYFARKGQRQQLAAGG